MDRDHKTLPTLFLILLTVVTTIGQLSAKPLENSEKTYQRLFFATDTLSIRNSHDLATAETLIDSLDAIAELEYRKISPERWQQLLDDRKDVVQKKIVEYFIAKGDLNEASNRFQPLLSRKNSSLLLLTLGEFNLKMNKYEDALTVFLGAYFFDHSATAEEGARYSFQHYNGSESGYIEYRDSFLREFGQLFLQEIMAQSSENHSPNYLRHILFDSQSDAEYGIVMFWDEFLVNSEVDYLREVYTTSTSMGLPVKLCYSGLNMQKAKLNLPAGLPITGINLKKESKAAQSIVDGRLPVVAVIRNDKKDGSVLFVGIQRSFPSMLPIILSRKQTR